MKTIKVRITFIEELLGSANANENIHEEYIASKSADADKVKEELKSLHTDELMEKEMTIFSKDEHDKPHLWDYQLRGFFKDACSALKRVSDSKSKTLAAYKKIIDGVIFVKPRKLYLHLPEGAEIGVCTRPARISGASGERVILISSESLPKGTYIDADILTLEDSFEPQIMEWLEYGQLKGLGPWRNSGKGAFTFEFRENGLPKKRSRKTKAKV